MGNARGFFGALALVTGGFFAAALGGGSSIAQGQCGGSWTQRSPLPAPLARIGAAMAFDAARGVGVMFGGVSSGTYFNETRVWDGAEWTLLAPATSPGKRFSHTMAYDSARQVIVLFGGQTSSNQFGNAETWEWDGTNWFSKAPAHVPPGRNVAAMAYDAGRSRVVLFGGYNNNDIPVGDTWEWDGVDWQERSPANSPTPRPGPAMAYDVARGVTVLFGGYFGNSGDASDETWEWDGTDWLLQHPSPVPPGRAHHAMAYDSGRGVVVMFGGSNSDGDLIDDTWEWDGANWVERQPSSAPSPRVVFGMAYDANRLTTVVFGGNAGGTNGETWEWIGPSPVITEEPGDVSITAGNVAIFSIAATGPDPLNLRWHRDGVPLADGGAIAGATSATLTIGPTAVSDAGTYQCLVSNPCGSRLSRGAQLDVNDSCQAADASGDCNGNGVLDSCEIGADASLDGDGNGNLDSCETLPGTSSDVSDAYSAPCGLCGGGMAAMMPLMIAALMSAYRRREKSTRLD